MTLSEQSNIDSIQNEISRWDTEDSIKNSVEIYINGVPVLLDNPELKEAFRQLCFKGINTWSNAPKDLKKLVDYIWNGKLVQDYDQLPERAKQFTTEGIQHAARFKG